MTTSSRQGQDHGTPVPPSSAQLQHDRAVTQVAYRSIVRLQVAEAEHRGLTYVEHPLAMDDLFVAVGHMSHAARLARLAELGEKTDDLALPEPPR